MRIQDFKHKEVRMTEQNLEYKTVAVSVVAVDLAKAEKLRLKKQGISRSLSAIVSEAVINTYKNDTPADAETNKVSD